MAKILPPAKAVRKYCLECMGGSPKEVKNCNGGCGGELVPYRMGDKRVDLNAIRTRCIECSVFDLNAVKNCHITDCSLYPYRMRKNLNRKGIGNPNNLTKVKSNMEEFDGE